MKLSEKHSLLQQKVNRKFAKNENILNRCSLNSKSKKDNFIKFINKTEDKFEYKIGGCSYVIIAEINAIQNSISYKTYLIKEKKNKQILENIPSQNHKVYYGRKEN